MGKLTDILGDGGRDAIDQAWNSTEAADEFAPLPPGEYIAHVASGELEASRNKGTPGYKLTFRIVSGPGKSEEGESVEYAGRFCWHDLWLTPAALPMTKRDLSKLGVQSLDQLEQPLPLGIRCRVQVALRKGDDGSQFNRVVRFDVLGIDPPHADPFAPPANPSNDGDDDDDTSFQFGASKPVSEGGDQ